MTFCRSDFKLARSSARDARNGGIGARDGAIARRVWLGGRILGTERFARRALKGTRRQELEREMRNDSVPDLPSLAGDVAREFGLEADRLHGGFRNLVASAARRELVPRAALERNVKPVQVARYLGIRPASVTGHLRALRSGRDAWKLNS